MVRLVYFFSLFVFSQNVIAAVIATVDRTEIAINESINLRYESSGEEKRTPDFSPINQDFDIVGQNKETSLNIINGQASQKTIYKLSLVAKRIGNLDIPEIRFANGTSASIAITVKKSLDRGSEKNFQFDVSTDKTSAFVQEQIILTVKLARAVDAQQESISDLKFSHEDIIIKALDDDYQRYEAMLNGRRHIIYERRYALFPQKPGELTLSPLSYNAIQPDNSQRRRSFFDDPFFNRGNGKRIRELSKKITFDIRPKPSEFISKPWLPAKSVSVETDISANKGEIQVGDSITRTITIKVEQQLGSVITASETVEVNNARSYPDKAETNQQKNRTGITSQRIERIAIVPLKPGPITFPEQRIEWWNTQRQEKAVTIIPSETIEILPNKSISSVSESTSQASTTNALEASQTTANQSIWFYIACFALVGWLLTIIAWLYHRFAADKSKPQSVLKGDKKQLIKICKNGDASAAKQALLEWAQATWPDKDIHNLGAISNIANDPNLSKAVNHLQDCLYNETNAKWQNKTMIDSLQKFKYSKQKDAKAHMLFNIK